MAAQDYISVVQQLYVSYFGRPADYYGLDNFTKQLAAIDTAGALTTFEALAAAANAASPTSPLGLLVNSFNSSPEAAALYGTDTSVIGTSKFVAAVYQNILGREADVEGLTFWVNAIQSGTLTRANAAAAITEGALSNTSAQGLLDAKTVANKNAVATNFTAAINTTAEINGYSGDAAAAAARAMLQGVTDTTVVADYQATVEATLANIVVDAIPTVNTALTKGVDTITGSAGKDIIAAVIDDTDSTFSALDTINAAGGSDILNLDVIDGMGGGALTALPNVTVSNLETVNVRAAVAVTADFSTWTGTTAVNVTQGTAVTLTGAATTALSVAGATGAVALDGGASQTVSTSGSTVTLGATTVSAGAIKVTHTAQGANDIVIDGGSTVEVTSTGSTAGADVKIGQGGAASDLPTGAVTVTTTNTAVAGTDATTAAVLIEGGSSVTVNENAVSSKAATDTTGSTVTLGAVTIEGSTATKTVTVNQTASTEEVVAVEAVAGTTEGATVKFGALKAGDTLTLDADAGGDLDASELTFTAVKDMTAAEVAAAFSKLVNLDTQSNGPAKNGEYTGAASLWTSAAASGDTVVFTSTTPTATGVTPLAFFLVNTSTNSVAPTVTRIAGVDAVDAEEGVLGVINGVVTIDDNATAASITNVTVNGYGTGSTIGNTNTLSKLADLSLANSGGAAAGDTDATMSVDAAGVTSLNLTLNAIKGNVTLDAGGASIKTLNVKATGANSTFALTAAAAEALTVSGDKVVSLTGDLDALKTITVTGTAGLTTVAAAANLVTSINTTGTTGTVTTFLDAAVGTYTGGAGKDVLTLATSTALTKAIDLGAGDDTLSFGALTVTGTTAALKGGDGTDTLSMTAASADALDGSTTFSSQVSGFDRLTINTAAGTADGAVDTLTLDIANLGGYKYITTTGTAIAGATDILVLDKVASNSTVVLTVAGSVTTNVIDAATGTADVVNVTLSSSGDLAAGTFTAANVETVNVTATDTSTTATNNDSLTLVATSAKTVTVAGNSNLNLTMTGNTAVTKIDGSTMTKGLTVTSANVTDATTITGGSGNDSLTAATGTTADVLIGGAGNDTLTANKGLDTLTGGTGSDTFVVGVASLNSSSYATITDFGTDDLIKFTGAAKFTSTKVTQADTAVFQDYANAAMNAIAANDVAWFQFNGNTYIVMDAGAESATFVNGEDFIVKLTGLVDLTNATFNDTSDTIGIF